MKIRKQSLRATAQFLLLFLFVACVIIFYKTIDNLPAIFTSIGNILSVFTPLLSALILFFFLRKPTAALERRLKSWKIRGKYPFRKAARGLSVFLVYLGLIALIALLLYALLPVLITGIRDFIAQLPHYFASIQQFALDISESDNMLAHLGVWEWIANLSVSDLISLLPTMDGSSLSQYFDSAKNVSSVLINIFVSFVLSIYICLERDMLRHLVSRVSHAFLRPATIRKISASLKRIDFIILRYFFGQFCDSLLVSVIAAIILELFGVPYGIVLGFLFGMFNLIPYFGPIFIFFVVMLITFISSGWATTLWTAVLLLVIQQIDANIINPKILGTSLDISPFWVILAVTFGGDLFGIGGMLVSVPVFAVCRLFALEALQARENKKRQIAAAQSANRIDSPFVIDEVEGNEQVVFSNVSEDDHSHANPPSWLSRLFRAAIHSRPASSARSKQKETPPSSPKDTTETEESSEDSKN